MSERMEGSSSIHYGRSSEGHPQIRFEREIMPVIDFFLLEETSVALRNASLADLRLENVTQCGTGRPQSSWAFTDHTSVTGDEGDTPSEFHGRILAASYIPRVAQHAINTDLDTQSNIVRTSVSAFKSRPEVFQAFSRLAQKVERTNDRFSSAVALTSLERVIGQAEGSSALNIDEYPAVIEFFLEHLNEYPRMTDLIIHSHSEYGHAALLEQMEPVLKTAIRFGKDPLILRRIYEKYVSPLIAITEGIEGESANQISQDHLLTIYRNFFTLTREREITGEQTSGSIHDEIQKIRLEILKSFARSDHRPMWQEFGLFYERHNESLDAKLLLFSLLRAEAEVKVPYVSSKLHPNMHSIIKEVIVNKTFTEDATQRNGVSKLLRRRGSLSEVNMILRDFIYQLQIKHSLATEDLRIGRNLYVRGLNRSLDIYSLVTRKTNETETGVISDEEFLIGLLSSEATPDEVREHPIFEQLQ